MGSVNLTCVARCGERRVKKGYLFLVFNWANVLAEINSQVSIRLMVPSLGQNFVLSLQLCKLCASSKCHIQNRRDLQNKGRGGVWMDLVFRIIKIYDQVLLRTGCHN